MLNIFADALLIATRMDGIGRHTDSRPRHEGDYADRRQDPPSRLFTLTGVRL